MILQNNTHDVTGFDHQNKPMELVNYCYQFIEKEDTALF